MKYFLPIELLMFHVINFRTKTWIKVFLNLHKKALMKYKIKLILSWSIMAMMVYMN